MKLNADTLKEYIKKQGLKLMKESKTLEQLETTIEDLDEGLIDLYQKKFDSLKKEEENAIDKEEFSQLKKIKDSQVEVLDKLVSFYTKKVEVLKKISDEIKNSASEVGTKGVGVFSNKEMSEFKNEEFAKNNKIKVSGGDKYFIAEKVGENNAYSVLDTNINGINGGDFLKISDLKIGSSGTITIYRKITDRFEELKTMKFNNVTEIIKNPA